MIDKDLSKSLKRLTHVSSPAYISFLYHLLRADIDPLFEEDFTMLNMFYYSLYQDTPDVIGFKNPMDFVTSLREYPSGLKEFLNFLSIRYAKRTSPKNKIDLGYLCVLDLYSRYSRNEILAAFDYWNWSKRPAMREGVIYIPDKKTDLFFVTLKKTEDEYSSTTSYEDYFIDKELFHWQSQNTTPDTSAVGQRYIHHVKMGTQILLFVREQKTKDGKSVPYVFLGKVSYVKHEGSRPMSIILKLENPVPDEIYSELYVEREAVVDESEIKNTDESLNNVQTTIPAYHVEGSFHPPLSNEYSDGSDVVEVNNMAKFKVKIVKIDSDSLIVSVGNAVATLKKNILGYTIGVHSSILGQELDLSEKVLATRNSLKNIQQLSHCSFDPTLLSLNTNCTLPTFSLALEMITGCRLDHIPKFEDLSSESIWDYSYEMNPQESKKVESLYENVVKECEPLKMLAKNENPIILSFFSWDLIPEVSATKKVDTSALKHNGSAIPLELAPFFHADLLNPGQKLEITLLYNGTQYDGRISKEQEISYVKTPRSRLFWDVNFGDLVRSHYDEKSEENKIAFTRVDTDDNLYDITFSSNEVLGLFNNTDVKAAPELDVVDKISESKLEEEEKTSDPTAEDLYEDGLFIIVGDGPTRNASYSKGFESLHRAAELGHKGAKEIVDEKDYKKKMMGIYLRAAELGGINAHYLLGVSYYYGRYVEKDLELAKKYYLAYTTLGGQKKVPLSLNIELDKEIEAYKKLETVHELDVVAQIPEEKVNEDELIEENVERVSEVKEKYEIISEIDTEINVVEEIVKEESPIETVTVINDDIESECPKYLSIRFDSDDYREKSGILAKEFPNGIDIKNQLNLEKFFYHCNKKIPQKRINENDFLKVMEHEIHMVAIDCGNNFWISAKSIKIPVELMQDIFDNITDYLTQGEITLSVENLWNQYKSDLVSAKVCNSFALKHLLSLYLNSDYYYFDGYISQISPDDWPELWERKICNTLQSYGEAVHSDTLYKDLPNVPREAIDECLKLPEVIGGGRSNYYTHVTCLDITQEEVDDLYAIIKNDMKYNRITTPFLHNKFKNQHPEFFTKNNNIDYKGLRDIARYYFNDKFIFKGGTITKEGAPNFSATEEVINHLSSMSEFTYYDMTSYSTKYHYSVTVKGVLGPLLSKYKYLRLDEDRFVRANTLSISSEILTEVERLLNNELHWGYVCSANIRNYLSYPCIGQYKFTPYLLESIIRIYGDLFSCPLDVIDLHISERKPRGIIVVKSSQFKSHDNIISDVLKKRHEISPFDNIKEAMEYLKKNNYIERTSSSFEILYNKIIEISNGEVE